MIDKLVAGDTLDFETTVEDYPASDGWTLKYRLVPRDSGNDVITITCATATNGVDYRAQVGPTTTDDWDAGDYGWSSWVEKTGARYTVDSGLVTILPDPAQLAAGADTRSTARQTLDAIEAVIAGRASLDQQEYTIGNRSLKRTPLPDLITLRDKYKALVVAEDNAERIKNGQKPARVTVVL